MVLFPRTAPADLHQLQEKLIVKLKEVIPTLEYANEDYVSVNALREFYHYRVCNPSNAAVLKYLELTSVELVRLGFSPNYHLVSPSDCPDKCPLDGRGSGRLHLAIPLTGLSRPGCKPPRVTRFCFMKFLVFIGDGVRRIKAKFGLSECVLRQRKGNLRRDGYEGKVDFQWAIRIKDDCLKDAEAVFTDMKVRGHEFNSGRDRW